MLNRKGFTLVELLAVILILTAVSLVAVASISSSLQRREGKECNEQKELVINASKIYFSNTNCTSSNYCVVTVGRLKELKYFNEQSKLDCLEETNCVSFNENGYEFLNECRALLE